MTRDDDLHIRLGRIRARGTQRSRPFIAQALAGAERAGGRAKASRWRGRNSAFGRGRAASLAATRLLTDRSRGVVVKARVVRHGIKRTPLGAHLNYLRREGVTKDGAAGRLFNAELDNTDHRARNSARVIGIIFGSSCRRMTPLSCLISRHLLGT